MRRIGVALGVVGLAAALAGGSVSASPREADTESADGTADAGSSRIVESFDGVGAVMTGVVDYERGIGMVETGEGELSAGKIISRDAWYMKLELSDLFECGLERLGKRRWLNTRVVGTFFDPFNASPTELPTFLRAGSDLERIDAGQERGVDVTRYRARLNVERSLAQLPKELPKDEREGVRSSLEEYWPDAATSGIPFDLAIDDEGRLRRVDVTTDEGTVTTEFFDYGIRVDVQAPPADQVITLEEFNEIMECGWMDVASRTADKQK